MTKTPPKLSPTVFRQTGGLHSARLIKAADAAAFGLPDSRAHNHHPATPRQAAEVRMVGTGPDYCDLEVVCGCGEVTRFRCWNAEEKTAAK